MRRIIRQTDAHSVLKNQWEWEKQVTDKDKINNAQSQFRSHLVLETDELSEST